MGFSVGCCPRVDFLILFFTGRRLGFTSEVSAMGALLKDLGTVVTAVMGYVGDICSTIIGQPLLLMTTGFLLIGGCIGIFGRLLSKN